jgi:type VI secretion system protein ImpB
MADFGLNLSFTVDNKLAGGGEIAVDVPVTGIDSFKPESVASSVPALSRLLAARNLLKDLKSNLLDNREFRRRLEELIRDPEKAQKLRTELQKIVPELEDKSGLKPI